MSKYWRRMQYLYTSQVNQCEKNDNRCSNNSFNPWWSIFFSCYHSGYGFSESGRAECVSDCLKLGSFDSNWTWKRFEKNNDNVMICHLGNDIFLPVRKCTWFQLLRLFLRQVHEKSRNTRLPTEHGNVRRFQLQLEQQLRLKLLLPTQSGQHDQFQLQQQSIPFVETQLHQKCWSNKKWILHPKFRTGFSLIPRNGTTTMVVP